MCVPAHCILPYRTVVPPFVCGGVVAPRFQLRALHPQPSINEVQNDTRTFRTSNASEHRRCQFGAALSRVTSAPDRARALSKARYPQHRRCAQLSAQQNEVDSGLSVVIFDLGSSRTKVPRLWLAPFLTNLSSEVAVVQMTHCPFSAGSV